MLFLGRKCVTDTKLTVLCELRFNYSSAVRTTLVQGYTETIST